MVKRELNVKVNALGSGVAQWVSRLPYIPHGHGAALEPISAIKGSRGRVQPGQG